LVLVINPAVEVTDTDIDLVIIPLLRMVEKHAVEQKLM